MEVNDATRSKYEQVDNDECVRDDILLDNKLLTKKPLVELLQKQSPIDLKIASRLTNELSILLKTVSLLYILYHFIIILKFLLIVIRLMIGLMCLIRKYLKLILVQEWLHLVWLQLNKPKYFIKWNTL